MEPKHRQISRELLAEIASAKFGSAGRLPSEAQLVKRFAASRPTVARALNDLEEQGLIERRVGSGSYVKPRPSSSGPKALRQLGLLIPGLGTTEFFEAICGHLAGLARGLEYGLLWGGDSRPALPTGTSIEEAKELCDQFIRSGVSGVFFVPLEHADRKEELNQGLVERLEKAGIAVVLLDRDLRPYPERSPFDLVGIDNFAGGYLLAAHLIKLGCTKFAYVTRPLAAPTVRARIAGVREAILDRGLALTPHFIREGEPADPKLVAGLVKNPKVEAVFCANDQAAAELLRGLDKAGVRVPQDLRVVGFDDVRYATLLSIPLTTIHQPYQGIAATAFRAMLDRIADPALPPRSLILPPRLVVRESCGAYLPRTHE